MRSLFVNIIQLEHSHTYAVISVLSVIAFVLQLKCWGIVTETCQSRTICLSFVFSSLLTPQILHFLNIFQLLWLCLPLARTKPISNLGFLLCRHIEIQFFTDSVIKLVNDLAQILPGKLSLPSLAAPGIWLHLCCNCFYPLFMDGLESPVTALGFQ